MAGHSQLAGRAPAGAREGPRGGLAVRALICQAGTTLCALPAQFVAETMRCLPVEPLRSPLPFVTGVAVVRGAAVPVVDLAACLGLGSAPTTRFVTVRPAGRADGLVALAVAAVSGVREIAPDLAATVPPLLRGTSGDLVTAIGVLGEAPLLILGNSFAVPDELWAVPRESGGPA